MDKLPMCRICLVENVRMYAVVNKNLHELYEKLTDVPFVTEDSRPILACSFCCAKLKQCFRLMRKCLEAEELLAQMMDEDCELNPSASHDPLEFCSGFVKCAVVHISIDDECQTESIDIKEELPIVFEPHDDIIEPKEEYQIHDDIIEPKEEYQSDDLEPENLDNTGLDIEDMLPHISDSDSESDVPLMKFKTEVEEQKYKTYVLVFKPIKGSILGATITGATVTKKEKLDTRRTKQEDTIKTELEKNEQSNLKLMETTQNPTSRSDTYVETPDPRSLYQVEEFNQDSCKDISGQKYKCGICQQSFDQNTHLTEHIRIHTGEERFKCDVCPRSFSSNNDLETHIRVHIGEKHYKCDVCKIGYSQRDTLIKHINEIHTSKKPYKCNVCRCSFKKNDDLKLHIRKHIFDDTYYEMPDKKLKKIKNTKNKCDVCEQNFAKRNDLREHFKTHGEKPYKCNVCQHCFHMKSTLLNHIRIHTGEKPYKCDICQRSFSTKIQLKAHIPMHAFEEPYKCDICERSFSVNSDLKNHILVHSSEKHYKCDVCKLSYSQKTILIKHIHETHTSKKPYKCNVCRCTLKKNDELKLHIRKHILGDTYYEKPDQRSLRFKR